MPLLRIGLLFLLSAAIPAQGEPCRAESGPHTAALVELYTSEGCDSCPPADRWLSGLEGRGYGHDRVVPIALHVDYWDYIGWKDPYARAAFSSRQRKLAQVMRGKVVYTPQVLVQGEDFRRWYTPAFDEAVARINARPARASISLALEGGPARAFVVEAKASLLDPAQRQDLGLYLASYENKLVSPVQAGENRGRTLAHDYVVFEWVGPIAFPQEGRLAVRQTLPLLPKAVRAHSGVVAFVQNRASAEVLQALMLPACRSGPA
ncbi:MAG TPA: DUF1223 domain-containing protein [Burkholderiales bacterium]|nr:DUF1223 domain-containing protein [Burkholderiales bacterium]